MSAHGTMTCTQVEELGVDWVLDELSVDAARQLVAHVADCREPHEALVELAGASVALAAAVDPIPAPGALRARALAAVTATPQVPDAVVRAIVAPPAVPGAPDASAGPSAGRATSTDPWAAQPGAWGVPTDPRAMPPPSPGPYPPAPAPGAWPPQAWGRPPGPQPAVPSAFGPAPPSWGAAPTPGARPERPAARRWQLAGLAAAAVLVIVALGGLAALTSRRAGDAEARLALVARAVSEAADPDANVAPLQGSDAAVGAAGFAVFPASGSGFIVLTGLPEPPAGDVYQAWYLAASDPSASPTSAGLMTVTPDGLATLTGLDPVAGTDTIALTVEPSPGSDGPTSTPLVVGTLRQATALLGDQGLA